MRARNTRTRGIISILVRVSRMTILISARARGRINAIIRPDLPSALTSSRFVISCLLPVTCVGSRNLPSRARARACAPVCCACVRKYTRANRYTGGYVTAGLTVCAKLTHVGVCAFVCTVRNE